MDVLEYRRIWKEMHELGLTKEGSTRQQSCFTGLMNAAAATGWTNKSFVIVVLCCVSLDHAVEGDAGIQNCMNTCEYTILLQSFHILDTVKVCTCISSPPKRYTTHTPHTP